MKLKVVMVALFIILNAILIPSREVTYYSVIASVTVSAAVTYLVNRAWRNREKAT